MRLSIRHETRSKEIPKTLIQTDKINADKTDKIRDIQSEAHEATTMKRPDVLVPDDINSE